MSWKTADERGADRDERTPSLASEPIRSGVKAGADPPPAGQTSEVTASDVVYQRVAPVVRRTVWFYAAGDPERDDIAQDALMAILRNRDTVADAEQLEAWAARVTFNTICSAFRRRKHRRWLPLESLQGADPQAPAGDFEGREVLARVRGLLERLPAVEGTALGLELLDGASQAEIARRCGCSKRTVRRRLKTARQRFMSLARADPMLRSRVRAR